MPIEIRELVIRASVESEKTQKSEPQSAQSFPESKRQEELDALKKMIEQKNER